MSSATTSASLFTQIKASKRLPSPPGTAIAVLELCRAADVDIQKIADVIMSDPALAGRLLRYANSPISGLNREITSIREAVMLLGVRTVKLTALGFSLITTEVGQPCPRFSLRAFWAESFLRAVIARQIAAHFQEVEREEAFTAGLLAGVGRLALAQGLRDKYGEIIEATEKGKPLMEAEKEALGTDHVEFGAQVLREWQLPDMLVESVASQSNPTDPEDSTTRAHHLGRVLYAAAALVPVLANRGEDPAELTGRARDVVEGLLESDADAWTETADAILTEYREVAEMFDVELDSQVAIMDLYAEAQEEATQVGMVAQLERAKAVKDNEDLLRRATTDALTGVANRAKFNERIERELQGLRRGHGQFALVLVDIDHFKKFNDTYGHQIGDLVLKRVATVLEASVREVDLLARFGGEEFVILAPHTDRKGACVVTARAQRCIEDLRIDVDGQRLGVTISSGLALTMDYTEPPDAKQIIGDADAQLYISKEAGRNTWSYLGRSASQLNKPTARVHGTVQGAS